MSSPRLTALKQQIEAAFAEGPRPTDDRIVYNPDDWESAELANAFKGKHWKEVTPENLQYHRNSFLSLER